MSQHPQIAEMSGAEREAVEMSNVPPTPIGAAPPSGAFNSDPNGKVMRTSSFAVVNKRTMADVGKRPRGMGGLFGKSSFFGRGA
jgi:hypothetical protein